MFEVIMLLSLILIACFVIYLIIGYLLLGNQLGRNRKFDILIVFVLFYIVAGRILELIILKDISQVGWSWLPVSEDGQQINFFTKLPWLFFNFSHVLVFWEWFVFRYMIAYVATKVIFKLKSANSSNIAGTIFYLGLMMTSLINIIVSSFKQQEFASYNLILLIISCIFFGVNIFHTLTKRKCIEISWGIFIVLTAYLYYLFSINDMVIRNLLLIEIMAGILTIIGLNYKLIFNKQSISSQAELNKRHSINSRSGYIINKSKRNWINDINSWYKKNT